MAIVSSTITGDPEISFRHPNGKWRVVIGWNHIDDTTQGLEEGKIWCWVSSPPEKLQVFDQKFNRSETPGEIRFCGVANFTMVLMFHPYFAEGGIVPCDMIPEDKKKCRTRYHDLIRKHRISLGLPVDDEDPNAIARGAESATQQQAAGTGAVKEEAGRNADSGDQDLGVVEELPGHSRSNPWIIAGDDEDVGEREVLMEDTDVVHCKADDCGKRPRIKDGPIDLDEKRADFDESTEEQNNA